MRARIEVDCIRTGSGFALRSIHEESRFASYLVIANRGSVLSLSAEHGELHD